MTTGERGRLVYLTEPGQVELMDFPVPPEPGAVVATVSRANVCGSDLHIYKGLHPTVKKGAMGHEMVGRVQALGKGVETDFAGQPLAPGGTGISITYFQNCRKCRACRRGQFNLCENAYRHLGLAAGATAAFQRHLRHPLLREPGPVHLQGARQLPARWPRSPTARSARWRSARTRPR